MLRRSRIPVPLIALVGWLLPGAGYFLIGQRSRGLTIGITILGLYLLGLLVSGIRVIEVPGYDADGLEIRVSRWGQRVSGAAEGRWIITSGGLISEVANKPWFIPQLLAGPVTLISAALSVEAAQQGTPRVHARLAEIGTLYTAIAGMLNLLAIIDSSHRAVHGEGAA